MTILGIGFILVGLLVGFVLMAHPALCLWTIFVLTMFVVGTVKYFFPTIALLRWAVVPLSGALLVRTFRDMLAARNGPTVKWPPYFKYLLLLVAVVFVSSVRELHPDQFIVAGKNFFQFWSIPLALFFTIRDPGLVDRIMKGFLWLAAVCVPLAVLQYLFFGVKNIDAVTGTFGGSPTGGGQSAALAIFLCVQIAVLLTLSRKKELAWPLAMLFIAALLVPVILSHAKIAVLFFPLAFFPIFGWRALTRPLTFLVGMGLILAMTSGVFYLQMFRPTGQYQARNVGEYVDQSLAYNLPSKGPGKLTRMSTLIFWWEESRRSYGPVDILLGHGLGAAKHRIGRTTKEGLLDGHIARKARYRGREIGWTALARLLWDTGIIGTAVFCLVFISAWHSARRMKNHPELPTFHQAQMVGAEIACIIFLISLPYNLSIINTQTFNAYSMFVLGYIAFWHRALAVAEVTVPARERLFQPAAPLLGKEAG